ncbi:integrase arm-type DNA-binding domain-containing protein [Stenotrophomonas sp. NPDC101269]|uniref:integrase arm-type DNA-binding domain-containing protein n=1 Tax=Stenotrophomonas TaxID=40323 RepID=UPI001291BF84|nr:integrase arm-type DNA-binding domain-containing protein [Stenotrophomonas nematodicola]
MENKASRRLALTATMVQEQLSFTRVPEVNAEGKIVKFAPNTDQKRYVVFDSHRDAPVGFGVALNKTGMSYILQRRIGPRVLKATLGNCRDITLAKAREDAKVALASMQASGKTPAQAKQIDKDEIRVSLMTVKACFALYRRRALPNARAVGGGLRGEPGPQPDAASRRFTRALLGSALGAAQGR